MRRLFLVGLGLALALLASSLGGQAPRVAAQGGIAATPSGSIFVPPPKPAFFIRGYGGKCLDFGPPPQVSGSPVFIFTCNGTVAQQVQIQEINARHEVILRAGSKVIGVKSSLVNQSGEIGAAATDVETPLELQNEANPITIFSRGQIFALDGDSIILAANRDLVVKIQNARGTDRTPLVLGQRTLADNEFWRFSAVDGSNTKLTSGFVRVPQEKDFASAVQQATPGTVIEVEQGDQINLKDHDTILIPAGVTIRGDRHADLLGPELWAPNEQPGTMLEVNGDDVRITGLRMRGPNRSTDTHDPETKGIRAHDRFKTIIDHNDMSDWTVAAVEVTNDEIRDHRDPQLRGQAVRVVANFLHHNHGEGLGYGVVLGRGGFATIQGNTFLSNRHAIAGDGTPGTGYLAYLNLVQYPAPGYGISHNVQQDFDMHGTGNSPCQHCGGIAGEYTEVAHNTFLGGNRLNFYVRGTPVNAAEFHDNVTVGSRGDVLKNLGDPAKFHVYNNQFEAANPTNRLAVGDFDGDGRDDLFMATGQAWYYAPAANAEWRFLSAQTDGIGSLLFGDFDGDGRTDVFTQHGRDWLVSWGGMSKWERINASDARMSDFAIGDFDGDHHADVFYADGRTWYVSSAGIGPFTPLDASGFRIADLRFGDFNGDGKTDVFSVVSGKWQVAYSGTSGWQPLRGKLTDAVSSLIVADFDGDGRADVALPVPTLSGLNWKISRSGTGDWRTTTLPLRSVPAVGRFDSARGADVLQWHDHYLDVSSGGVGAPQRQSRQDMH